MRTLRDLAAEMNALAIELPESGFGGVLIIAEQILRDLVEVTPVDTGAAISNWQVTLNAPAISPLPSYAPGVKGSTAGAVREAALEAGLAVLRARSGRETIYISNVLPYIRELNGGSSKQAPRFFVERAQLRARLFAESAARGG